MKEDLSVTTMQISVCVVAYNQAELVSEAIESVLAQTLQPTQIVAVDDGSTDGSQDVIARYASSYPDLVRPIFHRHNRGISATRNDALAAAAGDSVTFLDGDDRFLPSKLEREARLLVENPGVQIAYSNYYKIADDGTRFATWADSRILPDGDIFRYILCREFPGSCTPAYPLVRYQAFVDVGSFDTSLARGEDFDIWMRLSRRCRVIYCPEPLFEYRKDPKRPKRSPSPAQKLERDCYIYWKNRALLDGVSESERAYVRLKVYNKMAKRAKRVAEAVMDAARASGEGEGAASEYYGRTLRQIAFLMEL